jgi:hypothetical protein
MVRIPSAWARAGFAGLGGGVRVAPPRVRRIQVVPIEKYRTPLSVDLGSSGIPPAATFGSAGTAYAAVGPSGLGESWSCDQCYLATSIGQLDPALVVVYVGPYMGAGNAVQAYAVTGSLSGGSSQFGLGGITIPDGWFIQAYWSNGTPGATATLRVTGVKTVLIA